MHPLIEKLLKNGVAVTDGSWGTQMQSRGLKLGESPDSWNINHPDLVAEVAQQYLNAGSQVILTNTFSANRFVLEKFGIADQVEEINRKGVEVSKKAAQDRAAVFASIGPSGKLLVTNDVTEDALFQAYEVQAKAQAAAGADGIIIETMMDLNEAKVAVSAAKQTGLPVIACMVFDSGRDKDRTTMGNTTEEAVEAFTELGADVVGANCGQGIEGFIPICKRLRNATVLPIWMKPNAGFPEFEDGAVVYKTTAKEFAGYVPELISVGANFIGGCCGTDENFIIEIKKAVEKIKK
ncbi:MAG: homocysteine S-methyltransferase family protein [Deltaproteobacteria bacterium]|nr:homocysteine S-methyltransferase family protein [Deltaproteobacteria bacterium]MBW1848126.1 homocysteine S-methyltransferase family protein [Deltaproteobacteria bacterium]